MWHTWPLLWIGFVTGLAIERLTGVQPARGGEVGTKNMSEGSKLVLRVEKVW